MSAEYEEAFSIFDTESQGSLNYKDCATAVRAMGFSPSEGELSVITIYYVF